MSTPYQPPEGDVTQAIPAYRPGPGYAQEQAEPGPVFTPGRNFAQEHARQQPGPSPAFTERAKASNGFTADERAARSSGGKSTIGNWFRTGDGKLDPNSDEGKALAPAIPDGWSVASLITAFFVPLAGLVLSMVAFADAKKNHRRVHGTAIGGFCVGLVGSLVWTLYWVIVIVALAAVSHAASSYPYGG